MKTRTKKILDILKILAFMGAIGFSIEWGSHLLTFVSSFINLNWSKHTYQANQDLFTIREHSIPYYCYAMSLIIIISTLKAIVWYVIFDLLAKIKIQSPFSMEVEKKLEKIAYLLLSVWVFSSIFWRIFIYYLGQSTGIHLQNLSDGGGYIFIAGIVYIISQVFKRGIEMQEENLLTV